MTELLVWGGIILSFLGIIWGKIVIAAARDFVKTEHPKGFKEMSGFGTPVLKNFSSDDRRVDRALASKMLFGGLPAAVDADERMGPIKRSWRTAAAMIFGGLVLVFFSIQAAAGG